ncbi:MAG: DNA topoisomerase [Clostridiaceae bacterium]|nr:DNA topoisomerase [Clostridiaceae bacterium]
MTKHYDNESISSLKGADRVRLRPSVIFGSDDLRGAQQAFFEILSNSIDEARAGFGDLISITRFKDYSILVEDHGRGIPLDYNQNEERFNWELVYCELYAGGKYKTNLGENYEYSLGLNGLGACATQYASRFFDVEVTRDGYQYKLHFEKGENIGGLIKTETKSRRTGTKQHFLLDYDVLTDIKIPTDFFLETLKQQAIVNSGTVFEFKDEISGEEHSFSYPEGILAYVRELNQDKGRLSDAFSFQGEGRGKDRSDREEYRVNATIAVAFNNDNKLLSYYHNSSPLEYGGSPDRAVRSAFVSVFDDWLKQENKYKSNESKISFTDIEDSLIIVTSSFSTFTSYENQTKRSINNQYIQRFMTDLIRNKLDIWFIEHRETALRVLDQVMINKRSREKAEKMRISVKKDLMTSMDFTNKPRLFVDCRSQDVNERELYIVEGNSALGSVKMARNADFQAIIPVRGKILNCLKADIRAILNNDIIMDLIKVLGCGVDLGNRQVKNVAQFDIKRLRWSKVIICTDADVDGFQIRTLILAMFYRLTPQLLEEHKIFIAESPLFEITHTKGSLETTHFAYTERDKEEILSRLDGGKVHLQRSKGLGENEPEMMWQTTMNPESRRLIEVVPEDKEIAEEAFELLLGKGVADRREYIEDHGHKYVDMLDVV